MSVELVPGLTLEEVGGLTAGFVSSYLVWSYGRRLLMKAAFVESSEAVEPADDPWWSDDVPRGGRVRGAHPDDLAIINAGRRRGLSPEQVVREVRRARLAREIDRLERETQVGPYAEPSEDDQ